MVVHIVVSARTRHMSTKKKKPIETFWDEVRKNKGELDFLNAFVNVIGAAIFPLHSIIWPRGDCNV